MGVSSHVNIHGNELADLAARTAALFDTTDIPIPPSDVKSYITLSIQKQWNEIWNNTKSNKLRDIKSSTIQWHISPNLTRSESDAISRLRIGHTRLTLRFLMA